MLRFRNWKTISTLLLILASFIAPQASAQQKQQKPLSCTRFVACAYKDANLNSEHHGVRKGTQVRNLTWSADKPDWASGFLDNGDLRFFTKSDLTSKDSLLKIILPKTVASKPGKSSISIPVTKEIKEQAPPPKDSTRSAPPVDRTKFVPSTPPAKTDTVTTKIETGCTGSWVSCNKALTGLIVVAAGSGIGYAVYESQHRPVKIDNLNCNGSCPASGSRSSLMGLLGIAGHISTP